MSQRLSMLWWGSLLSAGLLVACEDTSRQQGTPTGLQCELGGSFLLGPPALLAGACPGRVPTTRDFAVLPTDNPTQATIEYAGGTFDAAVDDNCIARVGETRYAVDTATAVVTAMVSVGGNRLDAVVDYRLEGLPVGEECDVRLALVGQRVSNTGGNPTGGSCGTGATCEADYCVFGNVSACAFDVCVYRRNVDGEATYCSEPCSVGSCPTGYECQDAGSNIYDTSEQWFCVVREPVCGDGVIEGDEVCDDGNLVSGDGCSADCRSHETCGNGIVDAAIGEQCDDGNATGGDGCGSYCTFEVCGNTIVDVGETCDDGNTASGDGCSDDCHLELCGNGFVDVGEGCDDGNLIDTDGCDGLCRVHPLRGTARLDAGWVRNLPGGTPARMVSYRALALPGRALFVWSESYEGAGPFGSSLETYVSWVDVNTQYLQPPVRLDLLHGWQLESVVRLDVGTVVALLRQGDTLALSRSSDGGSTFAAPTTIAVPATPMHETAGAFARLSTDGTTLYLAFGIEVLIVNSNRNLFFSRSVDGGATWTQALRLSPASDFVTWATPPLALTGANGMLTLVWGDGQRGGGQIYAARSRDHGETWLRLNEPLGAHAAGRDAETQATLVAGVGQVLVAFAGSGGLVLARWDGANTPWDIKTLVPAAPLGPKIGPVSLSVTQGNRLYLSLTAAQQILATYSPDGGMTFAALQRVGWLPPEVTLLGTGQVRVEVDTSLTDGGADRVVLLWLANVRMGSATGWAPLAAHSPDSGVHWSEAATPLVGEGALTSLGGGDIELARVGNRGFEISSTGTALWFHDLGSLELAPPAQLPAGTLGVGCDRALVEGGWCVPSTVGAPAARSGATMIAADDRVILFGGDDGFARRADGGTYDVAHDTWVALDASGPGIGLWGRSGHTVVWTGVEMIVFGGHNGLAALDDGASYNPVTGEWTLLPTSGSPGPRSGHTAVWTGSQMVIYGGVGLGGPLANGGRFTPATGQWTSMHVGPVAVSDHSAVWTGSEMIVVGGRTGAGGYTAQGFRYNPENDTLALLPTSNAPAGRASHSAVWTGSLMLIWGGENQSGMLSQGVGYDPANDVWGSLPTTGAPSARSRQVASWTGDRWLVWGGTADQTGGVFNNNLYQWQMLTPVGAPGPRSDAAAAWVSDRWVVFGGVDVSGVPLADGGIFVP